MSETLWGHRTDESVAVYWVLMLHGHDLHYSAAVCSRRLQYGLGMQGCAPTGDNRYTSMSSNGRAPSEQLGTKLDYCVLLLC
jgi:hypothetical protein